MKAKRYAGWTGSELGKMMLSDGATLAGIADTAAARNDDPEHASGRQEYLENLVNRSIR